ncbi:hypothetical protein WG899_14165 [Paucibacter sp. AS339]|uniref:hypothetical protein n=1 Tax=Paucibacter hankyongi TaxID=3133434 RepID=UPI0030B08F7E
MLKVLFQHLPKSLARALTHASLARFERRYDYDLGYVRELFELSPQAFLQFSEFFGLSAFAQDLPPEMLFAAKFAATRHEDCGACSQLMLDMAQEAGVPTPLLNALIAEDAAAMSPPMRLAWRYAQAALARDSIALATLRAEVTQLHGPRAMASLALAVVVARSFPAMKHALGVGHSCARLSLKPEPTQ